MKTSKTELENQLSIDTPELVVLEYPLAGIGSRFIALLLDMLIQAGAWVLLMLVGAVLLVSANPTLSSSSDKWALAILILIPFLLHWGYFTVFEVFWNGQTPGKRAMKIRVIQQSGRSIGLFESVGRNFLRSIDVLPFGYGIGGICVFLTKRQQRLGDLVAGSLVVHERKVDDPLWQGNAARSITPSILAPQLSAPPEMPTVTKAFLPANAVARLSVAELRAIEGFLERRIDLPLDARARLALKMAQQMSAKMDFPLPAEISVETFLENVAHDLRNLR